MIIKENILNNGWHIIKFSDCIKQLNTGLNPRKNFSLGSGKLKYITAKNLTKFGTIDFSKCDFIDEEAKRIIHKRSDIRRGDILFSSRAPIGHCHLITEEPDFYDIGESIFSIRVNQDVVLPEYLCLYLASDYFVKVASKHTTGSIIMEIRISDLMNTEIIIPPREIQKKIAKCLNKIDQKIELNKMVNDNLEQQILSIYHYLFTQFDFPDEVGNPYCSSGGKMLQNDILKRNIPITWKVKTLGELCSFQNGINYDKGIIGDKDYRIINVRNISSSSILLDENELDIISLPHKKGDKYCVTDDSIIIARSGIPGATRILFKPTTNTIFCGFIFCCTPTDKELQYYLTFYLKLLEGSSATQTGGSILQNVSQDTLSSLPVPIPPKMLLDEFNQTVLQTFELIHTNMNETSQLINLRDWLLPMLMNGQATIND